MKVEILKAKELGKRLESIDLEADMVYTINPCIIITKKSISINGEEVRGFNLKPSNDLEITFKPISSLTGVIQALANAVWKVKNSKERRLIVEEFWHSLSRQGDVEKQEVEEAIFETMNILQFFQKAGVKR